MAHVLIGFAEALPAPEVVFSLLAGGHRVSAFTRSENLPLARLPLEKIHTLPAPEESVHESCKALMLIMKSNESPDIILPLDDTGLWLVNTALGDDPRSAGAMGPQAQVALDKALQIQAAIRAGMSVPETTVVRRPADLDGDFEIPAIAKPALAVRARYGRLGKGDATYLLDETGTQTFKAGLSEDMEPLLIQPLIAGVGEGVFGYADATGVVAWSGHERIRMMNPHGSGSSACKSAQPSKGLQDQISAFVKDVGWHGPFMIELLRDSDGTHWFMELNGRMWGSLALARRQGLEYPAWAVAQTLDSDFVPRLPAEIPSQLVQRNLGRELLHLLFVLKGPKSAFHRAGWPRIWTSLSGVLRPTHPRSFYNYDPRYPGYFLRDAIWTIRRALRR